MQHSIKSELLSHVEDMVNDGVLTLDNVDDWHFHAFNEDCYMIGYYQCEEWLKKHNVSPFEAIETIREYEQDNFGEVHTDFSSSENVVNMYVYILGEQVMYEVADHWIEYLEEKETEEGEE